MSKELLISLPKRGIRVIPPQETRDNMQRARLGEVVSWSQDEKIRLRQIINCGILAKRYPTAADGKRFMEEVDYAWRAQLENMAEELTCGIVLKWHQINQKKDIAVVLFGSVAKGLVRKPDHPDPSNIDLAVIGNFSPEERADLFDAIRPMRRDVQKRIISKCPKVETCDTNPGNAGIFIQDADKLSKDHYEPALRYIASNAYALYDPGGIWKQIEKEAISSATAKQNKRRSKR